MDRGPGDRALSEVVGFILIFGMLVTAFTVYQGIVVPNQNRQVEFHHNQAVQGQLQDLRNALVGTAATGTGQAVSVTLGATYPSRSVASNLGTSAGSIRTARLGGGVRVSNVSTADAETADYVSGTLGPFDTESIVYTPTYSFYTSAPDTVYADTLVYNRFDNANITLTDQSVFDGRDITIVTLNGSLSAARQGTVSVNTHPISVSTDRVPITRNASDRNVTVTLPTHLSAAKWRDLLGDQYDPDGNSAKGYVHAVRPAGPDAVTFVMERTGEPYSLRLARVGVGHDTDEPSPYYLTTVSGDGASVPAGGSRRLVAEVRDRYNNPVSGATVNVSDGSAHVTPDQATTGPDGRAAFTFTAPGTPGPQTVRMNISQTPLPRQRVTYTLDVESTGGGGGGGVQNVNPGGSGSLVMDSRSPIPNLRSRKNVSITLDNTGSVDADVTAARISFYFDGNQFPFVSADPSSGVLYSDAQGVPYSAGTRVTIGGSYTTLANPIPLNPTASDPSTTTTIDIGFDQGVENADFYVLTLRLSNGDAYTYFVSHPS